MSANCNHQAFKIVRNDLTNPSAIDRVATQLCNPLKLGQDPVFLAWCELHTIDAENDYDGVRRYAFALKREWEDAVLSPARQVLESFGICAIVQTAR